MNKAHSGDKIGGILYDIQKELERQDSLCEKGKFPWTCAARAIPDASKLAVLAEEFGEVAREVTEAVIIQDTQYPEDTPELVISSKARGVRRRKQNLRKELIQVAAVAVAWCEALDWEERQYPI